MTISILKRVAGQTIPRPFSRGSDWQEARELIGRDAAYAAELKSSNRPSWALRAADDHWAVQADQTKFENLDTDAPVLVANGCEYFAFVEA